MSATVSTVIRNTIQNYEMDLKFGIELARVVRHANAHAQNLERRGDWVSKQVAQGVRNWVETKIPC